MKTIRSELGQMFRAYLHQDYDVEFGSVAAALQAYREDASPGERARALGEIDALLDRFRDDEALYAELRRLGFSLYPPHEGESVAGWLRRARASLA